MGDLVGGLLETATFGLYEHDSAGEQAARASTQAAGTASQAQIEAANIAAGSQREGLDYLKEREALPRQFSEQGLRGLGGLYGMEGGEGSQQDLINQALQSPLYGQLMSGQKAGEESILRSASATGGLRSGNVQENLYDYNVQLQNQALLQSYNQQLQGLTGLAGLPSYAPQIAQQTAGIGQTLGAGTAAAGQTSAMGQVAGANALQAGSQNNTQNIMGLLGIGAQAMFSDRRLKNNIKKVSEINGHNWFIWDWNIVAQKMGLKGKSEGVLADEVIVTDPDCICMKDGFLMVDYKKLGIFKEAAHG